MSHPQMVIASEEISLELNFEDSGYRIRKSLEIVPKLCVQNV